MFKLGLSARRGFWLQLALLATLVVGMPIHACMAQTAGTPGTQAAQALADFKTNPGQFLTQFSDGGPEMVSRTRELAVADPATLDMLIGLLAKANKAQKTAIAAGLAQAARIVVRTNQAYAARIQQAIADTKDLDVVASFAAAAGDVAIAAAGGAGAGSGGASGGQTTGLGGPGGGGGPAEGINGNSVNTGAFSFTSGVSGGANSTTTNTTSTSTTVSP